ncbi:MAG: hypothetical protein K2J75_02770, partial [Clostridia bacterium]|nr:hypothetical protein [Clostridia bacterium]
IVILPFIISIIMCFFSDGDLIKIASDIVAAIGGFAIIGLIYMIVTMFDSTHWFIITLNILYCILGIICVALTFGRATDSMDDYSALLEVQMAVGISRALNRNVSTDYGRNLDNFNEKRDQELLNTLKSIEDED